MKRCFLYAVLFVMIFSVTACGKNNTDDTEETETVINGKVDSADDFIRLGLLIDVTESDNITDVSYEITNDEIAVVSFKYSGVKCELRGSVVYSGYELAGIEKTSSEDIIATTVNGYNATYFTLNPGRLVTWADGEVNYCLYVYVTANDSVLNDIVTYLVFENHYDEREDVKADVDEASVEFAKKIVTVFQNKDLEGLSELMYYPQQLESGESVANKNELLAISSDIIFTDKMVEVINDDAVDDIRLSQDEASYIIGSNYKNVYFRLTDDGDFKIIKINN